MIFLKRRSTRGEPLSIHSLQVGLTTCEVKIRNQAVSAIRTPEHTMIDVDFLGRTLNHSTLISSPTSKSMATFLPLKYCLIQISRTNACHTRVENWQHSNAFTSLIPKREYLNSQPVLTLGVEEVLSFFSTLLAANPGHAMSCSVTIFASLVL